MHFLPKLHKRLFKVSGWPVISNCGTLTEKASKFLGSHLKIIMQESWSYIKHSGDLINKMSQIGDIPENVILVTADIVVFFSVFHIMLGW